MRHLQRSGRESALIIMATLMGCLLSLTGCATPVHQQKAAESFSKTCLAYADFIEDDMLQVMERLVTLEATSIALKPERILDDRIVEIQSLLIFVEGKHAKITRIIGDIPKLMLEDDRSKLSKAYIEMYDSLQAVKKRVGDPMGLELPKDIFERSVRSKSRDELIKIFVRRYSEYMNQDLMKGAIFDAVEASQALTVEVRKKAARILEDAEQPLVARLAALDKYRAASELPYVLESLKRRTDTVYSGLATVSDEIAQALQDPSYKKEDLQAFIDKTDEVLRKIESAKSLVTRILSILMVL